MSFMLAMPKISFHGQGAIADAMTYLQQHNLSKALVVTDRGRCRVSGFL